MLFLHHMTRIVLIAILSLLATLHAAAQTMCSYAYTPKTAK